MIPITSLGSIPRLQGGYTRDRKSEGSHGIQNWEWKCGMSEIA